MQAGAAGRGQAGLARASAPRCRRCRRCPPFLVPFPRCGLQLDLMCPIPCCFSRSICRGVHGASGVMSQDRASVVPGGVQPRSQGSNMHACPDGSSGGAGGAWTD
eukprot:6875038-Lingulodinium_polyedra.AAC.1